MKALVVSMTVLAIWTIARCAEAQTVKTTCHQGDLVVSDEQSADYLETVVCIDGDLIWDLSFRVNDDGTSYKAETVLAPMLRSVKDIEIHGAHVKFLDFPKLIRIKKKSAETGTTIVQSAEWIDADMETAPMLCCFEIVYLAGQSGAYFNTGCRNWGCEPRNR